MVERDGNGTGWREDASGRDEDVSRPNVLTCESNVPQTAVSLALAFEAPTERES